MLTVFCRATASSRVQLHCGMMAFTFCKGALCTAFVGLEHRHCGVSLYGCTGAGSSLIWQPYCNTKG